MAAQVKSSCIKSRGKSRNDIFIQYTCVDKKAYSYSGHAFNKVIR